MTPYLQFRGTCAEAMRFYEGIFGGRLVLMRFSEAPEEVPGIPRDGAGSDRILHGELRGGNWALMASDFPPGMGDPQTAVSVMWLAPDADARRAIHDALMEGGDEIVPYGPSFFSEGFGMARDRFGTHWMISVAPEAASSTG